MDIRIYFQKVREVESTLSTPFVIVSSLETPDGGKPNVMTEVPRSVAARLVVEGKARLANADEIKDYYDREQQARLLAEQAAAASRLQLTVLSEQEARALRSVRQKG